MGKVKYIMIAIAASSFLLFNEEALSWDNNKTHKDISKIAAEQSVLGNDKGNYLNTLGLSKGLLEKLTWNGTQNYTTEWLQEGAKLEDGNLRELNHFHNPLKPWPEAGLHVLGFIKFGESAVLWTQDSNAQANWSNSSGMGMPYQGLITIPDNTTPTDWSWQSTRNYFFFRTYLAYRSGSTSLFRQDVPGIGASDAPSAGHVRAHACEKQPAPGQSNDRRVGGEPS